MATDILQTLEAEIRSITLIPSNGGRFEVEVNRTLVYSKVKTGQHPQPGEVMKLISDHLKKAHHD
ncbi:MAG: hypothetical protein C0391_06160 [Anaerolinea sp.]|nr:hypothetical protein [Anaerolinea sp.]